MWIISSESAHVDLSKCVKNNLENILEKPYPELEEGSFAMTLADLDNTKKSSIGLKQKLHK